MGNSRLNNTNYDSNVIDGLIKDLEYTTEQFYFLLKDIKESEIEFAAIKTELHFFVENVKQLADLIQETDSGQSLLTRLALVENAIEELEEWKKTEHSNKTTHDHADKSGKWQVIAAVTTGVLALITSLMTLIINLLSVKH